MIFRTAAAVLIIFLLCRFHKKLIDKNVEM